MLISLLEKQTPLIDVRAPIEFKKGSLPTSVNLPILLDDERHQVGKTYKKFGSGPATDLGFNLVSGDLKEKRVKKWLNFISDNPSAQIYCARGGQRSKIAQEWIAEKGVSIPKIEGGFKSLRNECLNFIEKACSDEKKWIVIAGMTGTNKTGIISLLNNGIDLEGLANHRGSAFGGFETPQPSPINFENSLACNYVQIKNKTIIFEDESRTIGRLVIPEKFYNRIISSEIVIINEPIDVRVNHIYKEYVHDALVNHTNDDLKRKLSNQLSRISKRLGMDNFIKINEQIQIAFQKESRESHHIWIHELLTNYYDKMYHYQLEKKKDRCIFSGSWEEVKKYLT